MDMGDFTLGKALPEMTERKMIADLGFMIGRQTAS